MNLQKVSLKSTIPTELTGARLDQALAKLFPMYSRSQLQSWILSGHVRLNGIQKTFKREKVKYNQMVEINATLYPNNQWLAQSLPLNILYEDETLLIVSKPAGLVVHPGAGIPDHTLVNALLYYDPNLATLPRMGLIHRLDKDTSGLLVIARNLASHYSLTNAMRLRKITREYEAIINGIPISGRTINAPIGRHSIHRTRMTVLNKGREAITHFRIIKQYRAHTHIRVRLETGRTHQIRVHMAHINHSIVGDPVYGRSHMGIPYFLSKSLKATLKSFHRQALHAATLELSHPLTQKRMKWNDPLPKDMLCLLESLKQDYTHVS